MSIKTFNFGDILSARNVCGDTLYELAEKYDNVWVLTSDCGGALKEFRRDFRDRYVDTGIAEQNAAGIAAGLALAGAVPHIMGMTPFMTMRACEQNRTSIAYQNLPVRLIGYGGGLTTNAGSTHYAMEDIALMRQIVNMTVVSPGDPNMIRDILHAGMDYDGPIFIRLSQGKKDRVVYEPGTVKFEFGKGIVAREGKDVTIMAHGCVVIMAIELAEKLEKEGISVRVVDMVSIKPIDEELILKCVEETGKIIVWEDHFAMGGLASAVADVFADHCVVPKVFKRFGIPQVYPGFGSDMELYRKYGYDPDSVEKAIKEML
jgi:transketolase